MQSNEITKFPGVCWMM